MSALVIASIAIILLGLTAVINGLLMMSVIRRLDAIEGERLARGSSPRRNSPGRAAGIAS